MAKECYRILSLDGGGIKGLVTLTILRRLIEEVPVLLEKVDFIAGTSTGGIIALGLADEVPLDTIKSLYYDNGPKIFKKTRFNFWGLAKSRYSNKHLKKLLAGMFGDRTLGELKKKVLIPSFDLDNEDKTTRTWKPKFFDNLKKDEPDCKELIRNVALYTSAAPTYFPAVDGYIDGGVCANNPSIAALSNVVKRGAALGNIRLLSLGTGQGLKYIGKKEAKGGIIYWGSRIIDILFDGILDVPDYQCKAILKKKYCRANPRLGNKQMPAMDDWRSRDRLISIAEELDLTDAISWLKTNWQ